MGGGDGSLSLSPEAVSSSAAEIAGGACFSFFGSGSGLGVGVGVSSSGSSGWGGGGGGEGFLVCFFPPMVPIGFEGFDGAGFCDGDCFCWCFSCLASGEFSVCFFFCCFNRGGVSCLYNAVLT